MFDHVLFSKESLMSTIKIKLLEASQTSYFEQLIKLFNKVFESEEVRITNQEFCRKLLSNKKFLVLAALEENEVIGGITAHILPSYYTGKEELFIYDLAVQDSFQRRGIGKQLMNELFKIGNKQKIQVAFVDVENEDEGAVLFYKALGGEKMSTSQFTYFL